MKILSLHRSSLSSPNSWSPPARNGRQGHALGPGQGPCPRPGLMTLNAHGPHFSSSSQMKPAITHGLATSSWCSSYVQDSCLTLALTLHCTLCFHNTDYLVTKNCLVPGAYTFNEPRVICFFRRPQGLSQGLLLTNKNTNKYQIGTKMAIKNVYKKGPSKKAVKNGQKKRASKMAVKNAITKLNHNKFLLLLLN